MIGRCPRNGTEVSLLLTLSWIRPPSTSVLPSLISTLVLGGLIQDNVNNNDTSVPFLGHLPIIGELFRARNTSKTKTDFLIFLQPHILRDDKQAAIETDAKYNYM